MIPKSFIIAAAKKGMQYFDNIRQESFKEFYMQLFKGIAEEKRLEYEKIIKATENDFYGLLSAAVNDNEKEKITIYVNLYKAILDDKVPQNKKLQYLTLAKTLPYASLKLLPEIYVHVNHPTHETLEAFMKKLQFNENLEYERHLLIQNALLQINNSNFNGGNLIVKPTFSKLTEVFFTYEELTPKALNIQVWDKKIAILYSPDDISQSSYLQKLLEKISIKNSFISNINHVIEPSNIRHYQKFILILNKDKLQEETIEKIKEYSKFIDIIKVTLENNTTDQLLDIGQELVYLEKGNEKSENNFLGNFEIHPIDLF